MRLVDRIAQCRAPFIVRNRNTGALTRLDGAADHAFAVTACPTRFVLSDELTRLCTALAYSKGARQLDCADLLRIPAERVWMEWCEAPWQEELQRYGFKTSGRLSERLDAGRRGALIRAARDGRSGVIRTFWTVGAETFVGSMEAIFDLQDAGEPQEAAPDVMRRCFRFRYERSWQEYYANARLEPAAALAVARHALGTMALDIPMMVAFLLLLATRGGLPRRVPALDKLNRARARSGKTPLLEHVEVHAPLLREQDGFDHDTSDDPAGCRRAPRLHHVRGHLVRRGCRLFWRMPHVRGSARSGVVRTRTVSWRID